VDEARVAVGRIEHADAVAVRVEEVRDAVEQRVRRGHGRAAETKL